MGSPIIRFRDRLWYLLAIGLYMLGLVLFIRSSLNANWDGLHGGHEGQTARWLGRVDGGGPGAWARVLKTCCAIRSARANQPV